MQGLDVLLQPQKRAMRRLAHLGRPPGRGRAPRTSGDSTVPLQDASAGQVSTRSSAPSSGGPASGSAAAASPAPPPACWPEPRQRYQRRPSAPCPFWPSRLSAAPPAPGLAAPAQVGRSNGSAALCSWLACVRDQTTSKDASLRRTLPANACWRCAMLNAAQQAVHTPATEHSAAQRGRAWAQCGARKRADCLSTEQGHSNARPRWT